MDNPATGGAATIGRRNPIQTARLKPLRSHGRVAQAAAENCTADWPDPTTWEAQAITEGRWINAAPTTGRGDADEAVESRWDMAQQEIARLVREELTALIQPVQLVSVKTNRTTGEVSGVFRSNGVPFNYSIKDEVVRYGPVGITTARSDAEEVEEWTGSRMDAGKPRNCSKGFACGSTCITKGKICRAKGGAAAQQLGAIVKYTGGAGAAAPRATARGVQGPGRAPGLQEVKAGVLGAFGAKTVAALKSDKNFQMAMAGDDNPLRTKEDWLKVYRRFVGVPKNERNLPDSPTVINGIDVLKNFRPWTVFGLDPKTATNDDIRKAFRKAIIKHHPDQGGDPRVVERLKVMRDSLLAMRPDEPRPKVKSRRDSADWSPARIAGYREVMDGTTAILSEDELQELQQQNDEAAALERQAWIELDTSKRLRRTVRMQQEADAYLAEINEEEGRSDGRMDAGDRVAPVAIRASAVLQALARINERLPQMTGPMRVLAQQARETALQALQSAGIDATTSWAEAV